MRSINLVREFHETYSQSIADAPNVCDSGLNDLRVSLLGEELDELATALASHDTVATLDALTDLQYVLDGAYLSLGFHHVKEVALLEVHRSNMSKLGDDGRPIYREDGKIMKGPNYSPPDLRAVLATRMPAVFDELRDAEAIDLDAKRKDRVRRFAEADGES